MWANVRISNEYMHLRFGGAGFHDFLIELKASIPSLSREYVAAYREWKIDREWIDRVHSLLGQYGIRARELEAAVENDRITEPSGLGVEAAIAKAIEATKGA